MKELNHVQMEIVSGAGTYANILEDVGSKFGTVIESIGWKNAKDNATNVAKNVGLVIDSAIDTVNSLIKFFLKK